MIRVVGKRSGAQFVLHHTAEIGRGAEGVVYRAGRQCVKLVTGGLSDADAEKVELLVRLSASLPGFAWPVELVLDRSTKKPVGYVIAFAPGETLESLMDDRKTGAIPVRTKVELALAVVRAVAAAHAVSGPKIVLGDALKAGNLIVSGGSAVIVDTASVSVLGFRSLAGGLVDAVCPLTTPGYVPPEVLAHPGAKPSHAADKFALAVLLFELFFGRHPTEPLPCPAAVGLEPDDAVRDGLFLRWVAHPELLPPTYDPIDPPDDVEELLRAALLLPTRPAAAELIAPLETWLASLSPVPAPTVPRRPWRMPRLPAFNWRPFDRWVAVAAIIVTGATVTRWAWSETRAFVGELRAASPEPSPPPPEPPVPTKPVGPPLFRELFK